jgi:integrase
MKTIESRLSKIGNDGRGEISVRLRAGKERPVLKTGIYVKPIYFKTVDADADGQYCAHDIAVPKQGKLNFNEYRDASEVKSRYDAYINRLLKICQVIEENDRTKLNKDYIERSIDIVKRNAVSTDKITFDWIASTIEEENRPKEKQKAHKKNIADLFNEYLERADIGYYHHKNNLVLIRALQRYEAYRRLTDSSDFTLDIDTIDRDTIEDFRDYLRNERQLYLSEPKVFARIPNFTEVKTARVPEERGDNTIIKLMRKFVTFFKWLNDQGYTKNHPFDGITVGAEKYGTPYYLTLEERNKIADFDLSSHPALEIQRDIFIFQCCVGCRVGDLIRLTTRNIVDGELQYIASKTKGEDPRTISVPLNDRALNLIAKYKKTRRQMKLFPFISDQKYNEDIKSIFELCEISRIVTVLNPTTGREEQKPISEIASSHLARRTFIGNLYKQVQDPNLICSLSGHVEGSKAFTRYRTVDREMKQKLVKLIE